MHKNYFKCLFCLRQKDFLFRLLVAVEKNDSNRSVQ